MSASRAHAPRGPSLRPSDVHPLFNARLRTTGLSRLAPPVARSPYDEAGYLGCRPANQALTCSALFVVLRAKNDTLFSQLVALHQ